MDYSQETQSQRLKRKISEGKKNRDKEGVAELLQEQRGSLRQHATFGQRVVDPINALIKTIDTTWYRELSKGKLTQSDCECLFRQWQCVRMQLIEYHHAVQDGILTMEQFNQLRAQMKGQVQTNERLGTDWVKAFWTNKSTGVLMLVDADLQYLEQLGYSQSDSFQSAMSQYIVTDRLQFDYKY